MYGHGFSDSDREEFRASIFNNLLTASLLIYFKIDNSGIQLSASELKVCRALASVRFLHALTSMFRTRLLFHHFTQFMDLLEVSTMTTSFILWKRCARF